MAGKTVAEIFGEIVWLASQDNEGRNLTLADLEWLVMPAVILRQFHIQYTPTATPIASDIDAKNSGFARLQPISVELFALCSPEVAERLRLHPTTRLTLQQWRSGEAKVTVRTFQLQRSMQHTGSN